MVFCDKCFFFMSKPGSPLVCLVTAGESPGIAVTGLGVWLQAITCKLITSISFVLLHTIQLTY